MHAYTVRSTCWRFHVFFASPPASAVFFLFFFLFSFFGKGRSAQDFDEAEDGEGAKLSRRCYQLRGEAGHQVCVSVFASRFVEAEGRTGSSSSGDVEGKGTSRNGEGCWGGGGGLLYFAIFKNNF